jgi:hypothetical protein
MTKEWGEIVPVYKPRTKIHDLLFILFWKRDLKGKCGEREVEVVCE